MSFAVWWAVLGAPLIIVAIAWVGLLSRWSAEADRILIALAMVFPTASATVGCGALIFVEMGGRVHNGNELVVYGNGFILALIGIALGFAVALKFKRWLSALGLGVSAWMLFWFGLMMSAAD
ncbi:MAG TPA: hypothetical protein VMH04_06750 [Candidatus Solibacter sp.]|nr:hypothetical protein [Candidatus Solibacter sp.]